MTISQTHPVTAFPPALPARSLRLGQQLLTEDGWQTVRGLLLFEDADQASVFTDERDDLHTDGWQYGLDTPVRTRPQPSADQAGQDPQHPALRQARRVSTMPAAAETVADCPRWCVEDYTGVEGDSCHSSRPLTVPVADVYSGEVRELGLWMERRHHPFDDTTETVGILEVRPFTEDLELSPANMRDLAEKLMSLADQAGHRPCACRPAGDR